jgi:hypothetical protein
MVAGTLIAPGVIGAVSAPAFTVPLGLAEPTCGYALAREAIQSATGALANGPMHALQALQDERPVPASKLEARDLAMLAGYHLAPHLIGGVIQSHAPEHTDAWRALRSLSSPPIVVVPGLSGLNEDILHLTMVGHTLLRGGLSQLQEALEQYSTARILVINWGTDIDTESARRVADFVRAGGLLMTTGWGMDRIFGESGCTYARHTGIREYVPFEVPDGEDVVRRILRKIKEAADMASVELRWCVEPINRSFLISSTSAVEIIVRARVLQRVHWNDVIMARLRIGEGVVYHMISGAFHTRVPPVSPAFRHPAESSGSRLDDFVKKMGASDVVAKAYEALGSVMPEFGATVAASTALSTAAFLLPFIERDGGQG